MSTTPTSASAEGAWWGTGGPPPRRTAARAVAPVLVLATLLACQHRADDVATSTLLPGASGAAVWADDFESGTLDAWSDGVDPSRHRVVTDRASAHSGSRYLAVTYPAGRDGGWLTHFLGRGFDSLYVSYYLRLSSNWNGGTKLVALYGSRTDDPWSAFGKAGVCPSGADFFAAMLVAESSGSPGPVRFYTYYPGMAREPDGVTCWGRYGEGVATYTPPSTLSAGEWHRVEFSVQLDAPGRRNDRQRYWLDGIERGSWPALSLRDSAMLRLNAVQLTFSTSPGVAQTQEVGVDDFVVRTARP